MPKPVECLLEVYEDMVDVLLVPKIFPLKRISKPKHTRLKLDLEKLRDPNVSEIFQAMIGRKFALSPS